MDNSIGISERENENNIPSINNNNHNNSKSTPSLNVSNNLNSQSEINYHPSKQFFNSIYQCNSNDVREYFRNYNYRPWEWVENEGYTCLHRATFMDLKLIVCLILEELNLRGLSVEEIKNFINKSSVNGFRPLHFASYRGNTELIDVLIQHGADPLIENDKGLGVIHMAAQGDQITSLIYFKEKYNVGIELRDKVGNTPLHWACYMGSEHFFQFILSYKSLNLNAQDNQGLAPIHLAVISEKTKIIKKLLHKGADRTIRDARGRTPYLLAKEKNKTTIIDMLQDDNTSCYSSSAGCQLCTIRPGLDKIERSSFNFIFFIVIHLILENAVFWLVLPHFHWNIISYLFLFLLSCVMLFFMFTNCSNPGFVERNSYSQSVVPSHKVLLEMIENKIVIDNYCPTCIVKRINNKTKHCFYCNKCVDNFDHHCYWVNNCVGSGNINLFFVFITFIVLNLLLIIYVTLYGLVMNKAYTELATQASITNSNIAGNSFPPFFLFLENLHLYDKKIKTVLCSIVLIVSLSFLVPVTYLWMTNLQNIIIRMSKRKKEKHTNSEENEVLIQK